MGPNGSGKSTLSYVIAGKEDYEVLDGEILLNGENLLEMASVLPPIFILLGLLDVWVERETMVRYMGEGSGLKGAALTAPPACP